VKLDPSRDVFLRHQHVTAGSWAGHKGSFGALGCTFETCDLSRMRVREIVFAAGTEPTRYSACKFDGSKFKHVIAGQARFERCSFLNVDITRLWFGVWAWDSEQMERVFAVAPSNKLLLDKLVKELERVEPRRTPFWLPGTGSRQNERSGSRK
jgi:hypothetical protein